MDQNIKPSGNALWYTQRPAVQPLRENVQVDVAIVGGGMAGLSAAQAWHKRGKKVALLEQYFCGAGATGKSSGFITSNAELSCSDFAQRYGVNGAREVWAMINGGVDLIRSNIKQYNLSCGWAEQNAIMLAHNGRSMAKLRKEHEQLVQLGYQAPLYDQQSVQQLVGSTKYAGAIEYPDSFGINPHEYCQQMKALLQADGVAIYEETPVVSVDGHVLHTAHADVIADYIVFCGDRYLPDIGILDDAIFHAQTFLMASQQLTPEEIKRIFPERNLMCWDMQLVYNYFRLTSDNRLLLGGGDLFSTYAYQESCGNNRVMKKLNKYFKDKFGDLDIQFEYRWSGLIGISKDIAPLIGADRSYPYHFYVASCAGLPIAAALGAYSAASMLDGVRSMERYFDVYRPVPIGGIVQKILGKKISFALCNVWNQNIV